MSPAVVHSLWLSCFSKDRHMHVRVLSTTWTLHGIHDHSLHTRAIQDVSSHYCTAGIVPIIPCEWQSTLDVFSWSCWVSTVLPSISKGCKNSSIVSADSNSGSFSQNFFCYCAVTASWHVKTRPHCTVAMKWNVHRTFNLWGCSWQDSFKLWTHLRLLQNIFLDAGIDPKSTPSPRKYHWIKALSCIFGCANWRLMNVVDDQFCYTSNCMNLSLSQVPLSLEFRR